MSSKRAVNNKTNERRSPRSTMLLFRSTPRAKQVERDNAHDARTAADTARSSHAWIRARRQLLDFSPKRGQQVHEALEFFLCESLAKHGERCRIWEAERFSTAVSIALGVGRTRVRDEAEPLHDEALSGGGAIFSLVVTWVTCLRICADDCAVALPLAAAISGSRADGCYAAQSMFSPLSLRSFGEQYIIIWR